MKKSAYLILEGYSIGVIVGILTDSLLLGAIIFAVLIYLLHAEGFIKL